MSNPETPSPGRPCPLDTWLSLTQIFTPPPSPQSLKIQKVPMTWVGLWGLAYGLKVPHGYSSRPVPAASVSL